LEGYDQVAWDLGESEGTEEEDWNLIEMNSENALFLPAKDFLDDRESPYRSLIC
jgi:hypothetical protein